MFVWAHPPNWSQGFEVTLRFLTDILQSRRGREQRIARRFEPRITVEFRSLAKRSNFTQVQRELFLELRNEIVMPFWPDRRYLSASASGTTVQVTEARPWMKAGALLCICQDGQGEAKTIASRSGTTITLETALDGSWDAGASVLEGLPGRMDQKTTQRGHTSEVNEVTVAFEVTPGKEPVKRDGMWFLESGAWDASGKWVDSEPFDGVWFLQYGEWNSDGVWEDSQSYPGEDVFQQQKTLDGLEVFTFPANWAAAPRIEVEDVGRTVIDYEEGAQEVFHPFDFPTVLRRVQLLRNGFDAVREVEDFFRRHRGRQRAFYFPNVQRDLRATSGITSGAKTLAVEGSEVADYLNGNTVHRALALKTPDGWLYNQIESAVAGSGTTILTMRDNWTETVSLSAIGRIAFLNVSNFASDAFSMEWRSDNVATTVVTLSTLEDFWSAA